MAATSVSLASCYVGSGSGSGSIRVQDEAVSPTGRSVPTHFVYPFRSRSLSVAIPNFVDRGSSVILKRYSSNGSCELIGLGGLGLGEERRRRRRRSRIGIGQKGGKLGGMAGNEGAWWPTTSCSSASPSGRGRLARSAAAAAESATGSAPPALERQSAVSNEAKGKSTVLMKVGGSAMATAEGMKKMVDLVTSSKEGWPIIVVTAMGETIDNLLKAGTRALEFEAGNVEDLHELNLVSNLYLRDMAATVIADALGLKEIQVWEGVDGVNKSTPQLVAAKPAVHSQRVVHFDKYHGLGNDFLLMCGNGIRCMAKFVHGLKTTKKSERYVIDTLAGLIIPVLQEDGQVQHWHAGQELVRWLLPRSWRDVQTENAESTFQEDLWISNGVRKITMCT
ncbi:hypothetical protein CBR_g29560 [Chara braunii]|uniref:Aspartate/glutamate/uridylate kinase domain-containing protein n=1 Tax=Chara braunii TaxID=69332 RepID=A0A388LB55_CHABU|nr:hypothetical protein CBR_g29560 [Chara braunii]|eukprot:GBG79413.1 hypothetical protein CBR_g29560 [Chara braunii]